MIRKKQDGIKRVLGLDASTKTIGISVIDYQQHWVTGGPQVELIHCAYYKPPSTGNILNRLSAVRNKIQELIAQWNPDDVALEDIILFMKGKSNAKTVSSLAVLNRTVGLAALDAMRQVPTLLNVMSIRHSLKKDKVLPAKEEMPELVANILGIQFNWEVDKKGKVKPENYDVADGIAVGLAFVKKTVLEMKPVKTPKPKVKSKVAKKCI